MHKHLLTFVFIPHILFSGNAIGQETIAYFENLRNKPYTVYSSAGDYLLKTTVHGISVKHTPCDYMFLPWDTIDKIITNQSVNNSQGDTRKACVTIMHTDKNKPPHVTLNLTDNQLTNVVTAITSNYSFTPYQVSHIKPPYEQNCETFLYFPCHQKNTTD